MGQIWQYWSMLENNYPRLRWFLSDPECVSDPCAITQLLLVAMQCLWIYDYFLTLGDEIEYAWYGRKSWIFALFIVNRYAPVVHLVWVNTVMFRYTKPFCEATKWMPIFHSSTIIVLAQIVLALRTYAVTWRNKLVAGVLGLLISAQLCFGIFSIVWIALGPLQPLPEIDLDAFKVCVYKRWKLGEIIYYSLSICFDILAFSTVLVAARRARTDGHPNVPSILNGILRDATAYFMFIFFVHFLSQLFLFTTPEDIQLSPGIANTIFVPVMASRLMLSLKKATVKPKVWSLETMTNLSRSKPTGNRVTRSASASQGPGRLHEIPLIPAALDKEDVELGAIPQSP